jgi:hypothetical protein
MDAFGFTQERRICLAFWVPWLNFWSLGIMRAMSRNLLFWILWVLLVGAAIWLGFATHWNRTAWITLVMILLLPVVASLCQYFDRRYFVSLSQDERERFLAAMSPKRRERFLRSLK